MAMMFPEGNNAKMVDERYHEIRQEARENTYSLAEWSPEEITRWNLDTAKITGRDNPKTYTVNRALETEGAIQNGVDLRTLDNR